MSECWPPVPPPAPDGRADGQRNSCESAGHEAELGRVVHQLVEAERDEVHQHDLGDRTHAGATAAPTAVPTIACSEIGVERTRSVPYWWRDPR